MKNKEKKIKVDELDTKESGHSDIDEIPTNEQSTSSDKDYEPLPVDDGELSEAISANEEDIVKDYEKLLSEEKERFIRLFAEFENYKKRTHKEKMDLIKYGSQEVLQSLLPVLDDFDRALKEAEKFENNEWSSGIQLIHQKLQHILSEKGLSKIEVAAGDDFNTDIHEAITQIQAPDESLKNKVIDCIESGYKLHDKIIRFAKVVVGN